MHRAFGKNYTLTTLLKATSSTYYEFLIWY